VNGVRLTLSNDAAYDFVVSVATGDLDDVTEIAASLRRTGALPLPAVP
jgi:death on curing protein